MLTREIVEKQIREKLEEIAEIHKQYSIERGETEASVLSMALDINIGYVTANNAYWNCVSNPIYFTSFDLLK